MCVCLIHSGPNRGHYIAIVKSHDFWLLFDDDIVEVSCHQSHTVASVILREKCASLGFSVGENLYILREFKIIIGKTGSYNKKNLSVFLAKNCSLGVKH